jgi:hypothetical protein
MVQGALEEESNAADGDGGSAARLMFDILEEEKVLAQFFLADQIG